MTRAHSSTSPSVSENAPGGLPCVQGQSIPPEISMQAVQWMVALAAPDASQVTRDAFQRWREAHPDHERGWQHIESFGARLRELPSTVAHGVLIDEKSGTRRSRRQTIKLLVLVAAGGAGIWLLRDTVWPEWGGDYRSETGERRTVVLADGSQIIMNTGSVIDVRFNDALRLVRLIKGEIFISTAPDSTDRMQGTVQSTTEEHANRPFIVETSQGRVRALGTRFFVRQRKARVQVGVLEGAVELRAGKAPDAWRIVRKGEEAFFDRFSVGAPQPLQAHVQAWTQGMLVARDMRLDAFITELARYRPGRLACDPAVSALRISGIYPVDDTDRVLDMLARTHPIEIRSLTRYWVTVRARSPD